MFVYWIKRKEFANPEKEGYVGISNNIMTRFKNHSKGKMPVGKAIRKYDDITIEVLFEGTKEECIQIELKFRPNEQIGWNLAKGGGYPPVCKPGFKRSEDYKKQSSKIRKQAHKEGKGFFAKFNGSVEQKQMLSDKLKNRNITWGTKISEAKKNAPLIFCPHCNLKSKNPANMKRYHFDNCKILDNDMIG